MAKFFVDAFADMFGSELETFGLTLAPSKISKCRKIINFEGYNEEVKNNKQLYEDILNGKYKIIHLTQEEWIEFFKPFAQQGEDIAFFTVSTQLLPDGGADIKAAFTQLSEEFPEQNIVLIDTLTVSRGISDIAKLATTLYKKEGDFMKAIEFARAHTGEFVTAFVVDNVEFLAKNPIVDDIEESFSGALINMKPIISINTEGKFNLLDKAKGFKNTVAKLFDIVNNNGENIADYTFSIVSLNADDEADKLYNRFLQYVDESEITKTYISLNNAIVIGSKCVGLTFHSK
ncbi:MAG: DegV family protein [Clostridia bacterium]|nr:DegV family protein [Clostridia bacterium]